MNVGSLFSGIGGLDLGLERAGMSVVWQAENDPHAARVLARHWPHVPNLGDVAGVDWDAATRPDLICGGFPCQPVAQNGRRLGTTDPRWLWPEFARAVRHLEPNWVVVENVPDLTVRGLGDVLGDLATLRFDAEWECVPAAAVGAPHRRTRLFVVAHSHRLRRETPRVLAGDPREDLGGKAWPSVHHRGASGRVWPFPDTGLLGVADGFPHWMDRLRCVGNAVVPDVAEWIGRRILTVHATMGP